MALLVPGLACWRGGHPWIVLTDPLPTTGMVLCVNLTTFDADCVDDECILHTADYSWIKHPTAVAFSYARLFDVQNLEKSLQNGSLRMANPSQVPTATLRKIRLAAKTAVQLDNDLRKFL